VVAGAGVSVEAAGVGACWQPLSIKPGITRATAAKSLYVEGFICCNCLQQVYGRSSPSRQGLLRQREAQDSAVSGQNHVLRATDHIGHGRSAERLAAFEVPNGSAGGGVDGRERAAAFAEERESIGNEQEGTAFDAPEAASPIWSENGFQCQWHGWFRTYAGMGDL